MTPRLLTCTLLAAVVLYALVVLLFTLETVDVADAERHFLVLQQMRGER